MILLLKITNDLYDFVNFGSWQWYLTTGGLIGLIAETMLTGPNVDHMGQFRPRRSLRQFFMSFDSIC